MPVMYHQWKKALARMPKRPEIRRSLVAEGGEVAPRGQHDVTARAEVDSGSPRMKVPSLVLAN
jgi:hypothetical protein